MAELDTGQGGQGGLSRRDFLKATAAATVAGCAFEFWGAEQALAYEDNPAYKVTTTTCPYCSASCGQRVVVTHGVDAGKVVDIYGDFESPMNSGGLCAKGAGSLQLVTNTRRIGAYPGAHPARTWMGRRTTSSRTTARLHRRRRVQAHRQRHLGQDHARTRP